MVSVASLSALIEQGFDPYIREVQGLQIFRVVESLQRKATAHLVDDPDEQFLLEELLEESKPKHPAIAKGWHYLIATPFRYPPLKHGSRFGEITEPSLFYAADSPLTAFDETAYYRHKLLFEDMAKPIEGTVRLQYTLFSVRLNSCAFLPLTRAPFKQFRKQISHSAEYYASKTVGCAMRKQGVTSFDYFSARAKKFNASNYGVYDYHDLEKQPCKQEQWNAFVNRKKFAVVQEENFMQKYEVIYDK